MRKTKKLAALMLAGAMAAFLAACGGQTASTDTTAAESADGEESKEAEQTADGETYKIGVLQLTQHVALDKTNEGFVQRWTMQASNTRSTSRMQLASSLHARRSQRNWSTIKMI